MPIYKQPYRTSADKRWTTEQLAYGAELEAIVTANAAALVENANAADVAAFEAAVEASKFRCDSTGQWFVKTGSRKIPAAGDGHKEGETITQPVTLQVPTPAALQPALLGSSIIKL